MPKRPVLYFFIFLFVGIFIFSLAVDLPRRQNGGFFSDESSYFAIIQSLAFDGDLQYTRSDIERIKENFWVGPTGLFLSRQKTGICIMPNHSFIRCLQRPSSASWASTEFCCSTACSSSPRSCSPTCCSTAIPRTGKNLSFSLIFLLSSVTWVYSRWITADLFNFAPRYSPGFFSLSVSQIRLVLRLRIFLRAGRFFQAVQCRSDRHHPADPAVSGKGGNDSSCWPA